MSTGYAALKRVLRYLKGTINHGILYKQNGSDKNVLVIVICEDWAGDPLDMGCRFFPVLHILLFHCYQYQTHCSMTVLHTYTVCYSYITVGVEYLCFVITLSHK